MSAVAICKVNPRHQFLALHMLRVQQAQERVVDQPSEGSTGGEQSITPRPNGCRGHDRACLGLNSAVTVLDRASQRSHPHAHPLGASVPSRQGGVTTLPSKQGAGGAAPAGGTGGVPLFWKTSEGGAGGTTAQAKPDPSLKDSAGHNKTIRPGRTPPSPHCKIRTGVL